MKQLQQSLVSYGLYVALFFYGCFYHISSSEFWPITISKTWWNPEHFEQSMLQKPLFTLFLSLFHFLPIQSDTHLRIVKILFSVFGVISLFIFSNLITKITKNKNHVLSFLLLMLLCFPLLLNNFFNIRTDQVAFLFFTCFMFAFLSSNFKWMLFWISLIMMVGLKELVFALPAITLFGICVLKNYKLSNIQKIISILIISIVLVWTVALNIPAFRYMLNFMQSGGFSKHQIINFAKDDFLLFISLISTLTYFLLKKRHLVFLCLSLYFLFIAFVFPQPFNFFIASILPYIYLPIAIFLLDNEQNMKKIVCALLILFSFKMISYYRYINYPSNQRQFSYINKVQTIISENNLSYLDGVGILPKSNISKCFASPDDDDANIGCLDKIKKAEPDVIIATSRLMLIGDGLFSELKKNYIEVYPCFWIRTKLSNSNYINHFNIENEDIPINIF